VFRIRHRAPTRGRSLAPVLWAVGLLLSTTILAGGLVSGAAPSASAPLASPTETGPAATATGPSPATPVAPTVHKVTGTFYENNSTFANLPSSQDPCASQWTNTSTNFSFGSTTYYDFDFDFSQECYSGAQSPSTLSLGGNEVGVGYSILSNESEVGCSNLPDVETSQVAFTRSFDAGQNFGAPVWIGNTSCTDLQALEPAFNLSSNGDIYGAFVEANYGNATNVTFPFAYANRTSDALAFTSSHNSGASFTTKTLTLAGIGNIARPVIASFGSSVYIVYENLDNNSSLFLPTNAPYPAPHPIALELIESSNGGSSWSGPYTLPGLNASAGYTAAAPSIAVSPTGEIAVGYATNRSCFDGFFGTCFQYGDTIVVATSANGQTWSNPVAVSPNATGEYQCAGWSNDTPPNYWYSCYAYLYQWEPSVSIAWNAENASDLYVTWAGGYSFYNASDFNTFFGESAVYAAASTDAGARWNDSTVAQTTNPNYLDTTDYTPVIGQRGGWVYVSYAQLNDSFCFGPTCPPGDRGYTFWLDASTDGVHWLSNQTLLVWSQETYDEDAFVGYTESMGFTTGGPVVTFSQPQPFREFGSGYGNSSQNGTNFYDYFHDWENSTGTTNLTTAFVWAGATGVVNFTESGLPSGTSWSLNVSGEAFTTSATTLEVQNVPLGPGIALSAPTLTAGYWAEYTASFPGGTDPVFNASFSNVSVVFGLAYGVTFVDSPTTNPGFTLDFQYGNQYYDYDNYGCGPFCTNVYPDYPWYFPAGAVLRITPTDVQSQWPISFWSGTGNGSSTNFGNSTTLVVNGVINETAWAGAYGSYALTFVPSGLPGGTTYSFAFNGSTFTATAPSNVTVSGVVTGSYLVSDIQASAGGGYEYFGQVPGGDEVYIPVTPVISLNFSYAYVDLAAPVGVVTFQANGLAVGDPWQLTFNGTGYSSLTPWINVSTRPGTYLADAAPVAAAANDTAQYTPSGFGPTLSVTTGTTYPVSYVPTFRVEALASTGGSVTGSGSQWAVPGTALGFTARPDVNYGFQSWTGTGPGSYSGTALTANVTVHGPITETATFEALPVDRFDLNFTETGLPAGTWWTVDLNSLGYSTSGSTLTVPDLYPCSAGSPGNYALAVPSAFLNGTSGVRFVPSSTAASVCTSGATVVALTFTEQYLVTPVSVGGGSAAALIHGTVQYAPGWDVAGSSIGIEASPQPGYSFVGWVGEGVGNYSGPLLTDDFTPGGPVTEVATFTLIVAPPTPVYPVAFEAIGGLGAGVSWSVTFNGTVYASSTDWVNVTGIPNGTYSVAVGTAFAGNGSAEYRPTSLPPTVSVAGTTTVRVSFTPSYYVSVTGTAGGTVSPSSNGFVTVGKVVELNATPASGYRFVGWTGSGPGAYSGTDVAPAVTVSGPVTEVATFVLVPAASSSSSSSVWESAPVVGGLAVVGLAVGLAVGLLVFRRRANAGGGGS
jgi:hypothetical protein